MRTRGRLQLSDSEWNRVWDEYDARHPMAPRPCYQAPVAPPEPEPVVAKPRRRRSRGWMVAALLLAAGGAWVAAPGTAAMQLAQAVSSQDMVAMERHLDLGSMQAGMRESLARSVIMPADGPAAAFLGAMADDMARAWAHPAALAEVARARGVAQAGPEQLFRAQNFGLTSFELPIGHVAAPITLRFEMTEGGLAPRWQVTNVRMEIAAPVVRAAPPVRLSMR